MIQTQSEKGFVTLIIIIVIALVILQMVFHVGVAKFFESDAFVNFLINAKQIVWSFWSSVTKAKTS